jgi:hypothetical protein
MNPRIDYGRHLKKLVIDNELRLMLKSLKGNDFLTMSYRNAASANDLTEICKQIKSDHVDNPAAVISTIGMYGLGLINKYLNIQK